MQEKTQYISLLTLSIAILSISIVCDLIAYAHISGIRSVIETQIKLNDTIVDSLNSLHGIL